MNVVQVRGSFPIRVPLFSRNTWKALSRFFQAVAIVALFAALFGSGAHSVSLARAQSGTTVLSPEAAVAALAAYRLTPADLPAGYEVQMGGTVIIPTLTAYQLALTANDDPHGLLSEISKNGVVAGVVQGINSTGTGSIQSAGLLTYMLVDANSARALVTPPFPPIANQRAEPIDLDTPLGDASRATHTPIDLEGGQQLDQYDIRWQHGRIAFDLFTQGTFTPQNPAEVTELAGTIDRRLASLGAPVGAIASVAPPATEGERIDGLTRLMRISIPVEQAPLGLTRVFRSPTHPAEGIFLASDPVSALHQVDELWKRVIGQREILTSATDVEGAPIPTLLSIEVNLDGDSGGAAADLADEVSAAGPSGERLIPINPSLALGDATRAYRTTVSAGSSGMIEVARIGWTHGPLLLVITLAAAPGAVSDADLIAVSKQVEAVYQATGGGQ